MRECQTTSAPAREAEIEKVSGCARRDVRRRYVEMKDVVVVQIRERGRDVHADAADVEGRQWTDDIEEDVE